MVGREGLGPVEVGDGVSARLEGGEELLFGGVLGGGGAWWGWGWVGFGGGGRDGDGGESLRDSEGVGVEGQES